MAAADETLSEAEQLRLEQLSATAPLPDAEHEELEALRAEYGRIMLRRALRSIRSGRPLLADADAA